MAEVDPKPNRLQRFMARHGARPYLGKIRHDGWSASLKLYAFKCPRHDVQVSYPHGWGENLTCSRCLEELPSCRR